MIAVLAIPGTAGGDKSAQVAANCRDDAQSIVRKLTHHQRHGRSIVILMAGTIDTDARTTDPVWHGGGVF